MHRTTLIPALLTTLLLCACESESEPRYRDPFEPLSGSRYIAFARSLATAVTDGHCDLFERSVDTRAMLTTAFAGHDLSSEDID